jgi:hypothetical protein
MRIQLFGLPGAGKTYIANQLASQNGFVAVRVKGKVAKTLHSLLYFLIHPISYLLILWILFKENYKYGGVLMHKVKLFLKASAIESRSLFSKKTIVDDGLCQFLITLFEREIDNDDLSKLKKLVPQNATIFIVESGNEERLVRMNKRGRVPRDFMGTEYLMKISPIWESNAQTLKKFFVENFTTKVIVN